MSRKKPILCATCGGPLPETAITHGDAFCTSACAREAYGNPLPSASIWQRDEHEPRKDAST